MKKIIFIAPEPMKGSGGVARIYNYAEYLNTSGFLCDILAINSTKEQSILEANAKDFYYIKNTHIYNGNELQKDYDIIIATMWNTAEFVKKQSVKYKAYLVQDFEAIFNQLGDGYVKAENSYFNNFFIFTYGKWLSQHLSLNYGASTSNTIFRSDSNIFFKKNEDRIKSNKICFIYQHDKPRRCPLIGLEVLEIVKQKRPNAEIVLVGSDTITSLNFEHINLGILTSSELNDLYNNCKVGFCISTSNPSCNAFDMMYTGLPCVELYRDTNLYDMPDDANILLAHSTPESMAAAIIKLFDDNELNLRMSEQGIKKSIDIELHNIDEKKEFKIFIEKILNNELCDNENFFDKTYNLGPVISKSIFNNNFEKIYKKFILLDENEVCNNIVPLKENKKIGENISLDLFNKFRGDKYKLVTIDVWDTLLRRTCSPDETKLIGLRYLYLNYGNELKEQYCDVEILFKLRQKYEYFVGQKNKLNGFDNEYKIEDVLFYLLKEVMLSDDINKFEMIIGNMIKEEFSFEKKVIYADRNISNLVSKIKCDQILFLSDFYLSSNLLSELIESVFEKENCIPKNGYVSCEINYNKASGKLFNYVLDKHNIKPSEYLHIGDNIHSDVNVPINLGIDVLHYFIEDENVKNFNLNQNFNNKNFAYELVSLLSDNQIINSINSIHKNIYLYGYHNSLLFSGYIMYIYEKAFRYKAKKIYFLTREGEFLSEIYKNFMKVNPYSSELIDYDILEVSRIATFSASLEKLTLENMMRVWNMYSTQSMVSMFKTLNITIDDYIIFFEKYKIDINQEILHPWLDDSIIALFSDNEFISKINTILSNKRKELLKYFESKGIIDGDDIFLVEIGWRGTIQDNIANIFQNSKIYGIYLGLNKFLNMQPSNCVKIAYGPNLNISNDYSELLDIVAPIEMLCNSPFGSTIEYNESKAIRYINKEENKQFFRVTQHFQQGINKGSINFFHILKKKALTSSFIRYDAMNSWRNILDNPNIYIAKAYFKLNHNEQFGVGKFIKSGYYKLLIKVIFNLCKLNISEAKNIINNSPWKQGFITVSKINKLKPIYEKIRRVIK